MPATDKLSKGLRHFSWRVCEKVQQKKVTTYNEVCVCVLVTGELVVFNMVESCCDK